MFQKEEARLGGTGLHQKSAARCRGGSRELAALFNKALSMKLVRPA